MTRERLIEALEILKSLIEWDKPMECYVALETAIEALQQPTTDEIIRKCAEAEVTENPCEKCEHIGEFCTYDACVKRHEDYLREKVLNND